MKKKSITCDKCNKQITHGEACEECVVKMQREILEACSEGEDTGTLRGGCFTSLNKHIGEAIERLTEKARYLHSAYREYGDEASRRATFIGSWPSRLSYERIEQFARWGLFYTGCGDLVRCFQCNIGLHEWSEEDEPLKEHIRYSPNCQHLQNAVLHSRSFHVNKILEVAKLCFYGQSYTEMPTERSVQQLQKYSDIHAMTEENKALKMQMTCKVCSKDWKKILFLPCQHLWVCQSCGMQLVICPCGKPVKKKIAVIFEPNC